ncbi:tRNA preQ1(34) S-adenosylmethionine ribosyltransferase-isomerase QueA [Cyanobacteria bacterium FACHB-DQ100]|uniref:tRNA preQ1(34) S-adenosylmethionine ribosyltransferase-isomerase QueA n=1 Tax=Leptolyngbya sp. DQ-M1 TaxID=2933920 RepID=UPI00199F07E2|nr:tRNA preQ1(34) S-adenosylmethionine ribosyltransferase-isomerase QueA [Cyanobacteria bacterium FACHB-DQ100]
MTVEADQLLSAYDYHLPEERIAQNPATPRDSARLLVIESQTQHCHRIFRELDEILRPGDLLVLNNTQVIPARLHGHKTTGTEVEILLLEEHQQNQWLALVKPGRRLKPGNQIVFKPHGETEVELTASILASDPETRGRILQFQASDGRSLLEVIDQFGEVPLPPYIHETEAEPNRYQTVYADRRGAVAAPTAGLHFTPELLERLEQKGIEKTFITLHVGVGTFRPVEVEDITQHQMHGEWIEVSPKAVEKIRETQARGGRVFAVGTTVVRSLEGASQSGQIEPYCGKTNLFIYPGYEWRTVNGLITNFHLPKSSLLMLVSALIGRERLLKLYQDAIENEYRFYSFGDAMLILPEARLH